MKRTGKTFLILLFLLASVALRAQVTTISAPDQTVEPGIITGADISVAAFKDIITVQFTLEWDSTVLKFAGLENFGMEDLTVEDNFGINLASGGKLTFSWFDPSDDIGGVTLNDQEVLFSVLFEVIGTPGDSSAVSFTDEPTLREVADTSFTAIPVDFINGMIKIIGPNSTFSNDAPEMIRFGNSFPNPFKELTTLPFELAKATDIQMDICDNHGHVIFSERRHFSSGSQVLTFSKDIFPQAGIYYLKMSGSDLIATLKLIRL